MQFNKLYNDAKHEFVQADVLEAINDLPKDAYDIIICDPPTFSNSKRMEDNFDVQRDHVALLKKLLKATKEEGHIYFSNNYHKFQLDKDAIPAFEIKDITGATTPFDFQGRLNRSCFLLTK
jgi:23S rRNA (cytosine1962-C5)-methyltransferase